MPCLLHLLRVFWWMHKIRQASPVLSKGGDAFSGSSIRFLLCAVYTKYVPLRGTPLQGKYDVTSVISMRLWSLFEFRNGIIVIKLLLVEECIVLLDILT